jgi:hypothetical protein
MEEEIPKVRQQITFRKGKKEYHIEEGSELMVPMLAFFQENSLL